MAVTVIYLGDGDVGEAVVYGLPFTVGVATALPDGFPFAHKIVNNPTFQVVAATPLPAADVGPVGAPAAKTPRRGGKGRAG
jgi:hypothetical protein